MKKMFFALLSFLICIDIFAADVVLDKARALYESGLYSQAMNLLLNHPQYGNDPLVDGYVVLCAQKQHSRGYENMVETYLDRNAGCSLAIEVRKELAFDLFDRQDYAGALKELESMSMSYYPKKQHAEYMFKKGYCYYKLESYSAAIFEFDKVGRLPINDYTAPSQYVAGYINYGDSQFRTALTYFERSAKDERFEAISNYYIINCKYELDDYDFVISKGVEMLENNKTPQERKAHLARIISESYLVKGDKASARSYYEMSHDDSVKTRADFFYAGSLLYVTGDYQQAVENFNSMPEKTDSLGQVAWYQSALCYIQLKNKVAALDAFKNASGLYYDRKITEDAHFNYAKLAFDLNGDTSVFADYIRTYSDKVRGEMIYSYMALTALADKDYQSAIDAYDRIDVLAGQEKNNYIHANYLRGAELLSKGAYRKSTQCMKAVTYYTERTDLVNQLARFGLAEAYYRDGRYVEAKDQFSDLYNTSGLYGLEQGKQLAYNVAYAYFKMENYPDAKRWFTVYMNDGGKDTYQDAMLRCADCDFAAKAYAPAAEGYEAYIARFSDLNDIYPYYQAALCYGLSSTEHSKKWREVAKLLEKKVAILSKVKAADPSAPMYAEAMLELGKTLSTQKKNKEALAVLEDMVSRAPASVAVAQAMLEIGTLKRNASDIEGALASYKTVVEKMEATSLADDALLAIESIYQSQNAPQKYIKYLESIGRGSSKTEEEKEDMYFNAAQQIFFADNYPAAINAFTDYMQSYPKSAKTASALYYIGESYRYQGDKEQACDAYAKVIGIPGNQHMENALRNHAALNYSMENFTAALASYSALYSAVSTQQKKLDAASGCVRSAFRDKNYAQAVQWASKDEIDACTNEALKREMSMIKAKSLLASSQRDEAFAQLAVLARDPKSVEGAEAAYMIIQDCYDKADFEAVKEKVYALSDSGTRQQYYLAKAFILLGDSFAEQGKLKQAQATFQSIADGYKDDARITEEIRMRLDKLAENNQ